MTYFFSRTLRLLCLLLLGAAGRLSAQAPAWAWATSPSLGQGLRTAVDAAGNVYVIGSFHGTAIFGATILIDTNICLDDGYVAKMTSAGAWQWAVQVRNITPWGLAVDNSGNVVVTGIFSDTAAFGSTTLTTGDADVFVAKLNSTGVWQWATSAGGGAYDQGHGVAVDSSGDVYITGRFSGVTASFGPTTLTNTRAGGGEVFVAKLTPAGAWQWAVQAGGTGDDIGTGIAVDSTGNVIVTGGFSNATATFGSMTLTNEGDVDVFVAKLTPAGTWQWATKAGGAGFERSTSIAVDNSGYIILTGYFNSPTATFDPTVLTTAGSLDIFVAKLTPGGAWQWATSAGGSNTDDGYGVAVDGSGRVYVAGSFTDTATFGTSTLISAGDRDVFVANLTPVGVWQWAIRAGGTGAEIGVGVAVDGNGNTIVTGFFYSSTVSFGPYTLTNSGLRNDAAIFIARLGTTTGLPEASPTLPFTLSPNPAYHTATLTGLPAGATATLRDALGRPVRTALVAAGAATLDVRGLAAGLYFVHAGGATRRLVVE